MLSPFLNHDPLQHSYLVPYAGAMMPSGFLPRPSVDRFYSIWSTAALAYPLSAKGPSGIADRSCVGMKAAQPRE
jgi:hypothetical protein